MLLMKNTLISILAATAISTPVIVAPAIVSPAAAQATLSVGVTIGVPPPVPMYEVVPPPRVGFVWAPGYWYWDGGRHLWTPGRWIAERPGFHWVPDRWARVEGGWHHEYGHWDHDVVRHGWNR